LGLAERGWVFFVRNKIVEGRRGREKEFLLSDKAGGLVVVGIGRGGGYFLLRGIRPGDGVPGRA